MMLHRDTMESYAQLPAPPGFWFVSVVYRKRAGCHRIRLSLASCLPNKISYYRMLPLNFPVHGHLEARNRDVARSCQSYLLTGMGTVAACTVDRISPKMHDGTGVFPCPYGII